MRPGIKVAIALGATALLGGAATVYTLDAMAGNPEHARPDVTIAVDRTAEVGLTEPGRLLFRSTAPGPDHGKVASVPLADPGGLRRISPLSCDRFYAEAGTGICLATAPGLMPSAVALRVDERLRETERVDVAGIPSRAKLSAGGRMATWTTFVTGDSYTQGSGFSTRTAIQDRGERAYLSNIEGIPLTVEGRPYQAEDVNVWGAGFTADGKRFYATVSTAGRTHLLEGDYDAWTARTLLENAECPSLSPDGTRLAVKKRVSGDAARPWREYVLDLATLRETPLAETRSVDDQVVWLDSQTIAYELPRDGGSDIWAVPADGSGAPRLLVPWGASPSIT
ncbi:TolB family protein [Amycolatopsis lurida]